MANKTEERKDFMLSTFDNPFNPFEDFETWFKYDMILRHNCCGLMAQYALTSPIFSDEVNERYEDMAMDEIVASDPTLYRKVTPEDYKEGIESKLPPLVLASPISSS